MTITHGASLKNTTKNLIKRLKHLHERVGARKLKGGGTANHRKSLASDHKYWKARLGPGFWKNANYRQM
jgi:hypothetical protein